MAIPTVTLLVIYTSSINSFGKLTTYPINTSTQKPPPGETFPPGAITVTISSSSDLPGPLATSTSSTKTTSSSTSSSVFSSTSTTSSISSSTSSSTTPTSSASRSSTSPARSSGAKAPSSSNHSSSSISAGEAAGIGIATAIVGALIAAALLWFFCMGRIKRRGERKNHGGYARGSDVEQSGVTRAPVVLDDNLLERADDSHIRKSMQDLNELIDQHVENHYHLHVFDPQQATLERRLTECGYSTNPSVQEMVSLLSDPKTRFVAIRQVIAATVLTHTNWKTEPEISLLPPQIALFCQTIAPVEKQPGSQEVFDKAFDKWRHLSAFLLEPIRTNRSAPTINKRELATPVARNVTIINSVLRPFIKSGADVARSQETNLNAIVFEGAKLGLLLFSQPGAWIFGWDAPRRRDDSHQEKSGARILVRGAGKPLVVFPAIGERQGMDRVRNVLDADVVDV